jgi:hypothetical protein
VIKHKVYGGIIFSVKEKRDSSILNSKESLNKDLISSLKADNSTPTDKAD